MRPKKGWPIPLLKEDCVMQYDDSIDNSRQYLRLALEFIGKYGLPTNPLNYCVWYEYASGKNGELNAAVDNHLKSNGAFTKEIIEQLFNQYIVNDRETLTTLIRNELKKLFAKIIGAIKTTNQDFSESESNLETIDKALAPSLPEADVEKIVAKIRQEIKRLESSNDAFKEQIQQANNEIDQLKMKMERYRKEANLDALTRIDNRRGFVKNLNQAIEHAKTSDTNLCLIIADIDHFKKFNDTHGHLVGDNVLRIVATTIKECIKGKDMVARVGGEEFAIILPDTPSDGAIKLANDMRLTFERLDLKKKNTGESLGKITLSFGVATCRKGEAAEDFASRADKALYQSKKSGRNKVTGL
jgi:diguanylate cyclase